jgi:hypothetical protein
LESAVTEWSEWKDHAQGPAPVAAHVIVIVGMSNGDELCPMEAGEIDWDFVDDMVVKYKIQQLRALADLKRVVSLDLETA